MLIVAGSAVKPCSKHFSCVLKPPCRPEGVGGCCSRFTPDGTVRKETRKPGRLSQFSLHCPAMEEAETSRAEQFFQASRPEGKEAELTWAPPVRRVCPPSRPDTATTPLPGEGRSTRPWLLLSILPLWSPGHSRSSRRGAWLHGCCWPLSVSACPLSHMQQLLPRCVFFCLWKVSQRYSTFRF